MDEHYLRRILYDKAGLTPVTFDKALAAKAAGALLLR